MTPPGIDQETVRLIAQCLNHYATPGPRLYVGQPKNYSSIPTWAKRFLRLQNISSGAPLAAYAMCNWVFFQREKRAGACHIGRESMWHAQGQLHLNINCIFYNLIRLQKWNICNYKHAIMGQDLSTKCSITNLKLLNVQYIRTVSESNIKSGEGNETN